MVNAANASNPLVTHCPQRHVLVSVTQVCQSLAGCTASQKVQSALLVDYLWP